MTPATMVRVGSLGTLTSVLVLGAVIFSGCITTPEPAPQLNVYEQARETVVRVTDGHGHGSGVVISKDGLIVTNRHVVGENKEMTVEWYSGRSMTAKVLWTSSAYFDLALMKVEPDLPLKVATLRRDPVRLGEKVFAIGSPGVFPFTVTQGYVSRTVADYIGTEVVQLDLDINPGNSGGGLFDAQGQLVGLPVAIAFIPMSPWLPPLDTDISFAVPIRSVCTLLMCG